VSQTALVKSIGPEPSCVSDIEIDAQADFLIDQINKVRRESKNMMSHMSDKFNIK